MNASHPAIRAALAPLVELLLPVLREALAGELAAELRGAGEWIDQEASPLGRRAHCRACASGALPGARKVGRRWMVQRSAVDAYIAAHGRPAEAPPTVASSPANDTAPTRAEVEAELRAAGMTGARAERRKAL